ncbi:hypothetical protein RZS08_53835, partial [Arthrospira platensis SPKY1]|nr:hypothetical protein [Arthrospira platensis SPKY1]
MPPLIDRWLFSGPIAMEHNLSDSWPDGVHLEYETEFLLDGAELNDNEQLLKDWLEEWLRRSTWQSQPLRTELWAAISKAMEASSNVTVR